MLFFKCRDEGEELKVGFNFYRLSDKVSFGFIFYCIKIKFRIRYSKVTGKLFADCTLKPHPTLKEVLDGSL